MGLMCDRVVIRKQSVCARIASLLAMTEIDDNVRWSASYDVSNPVHV
jgi:hypothetical protein